MQRKLRRVLYGVLLGTLGLLIILPAWRSVHAARTVRRVELPNGWKLTPAGRVVDLAGDMPLCVWPLPGGRRALILTGGYHDHSLSLVNIPEGRVLQTLELGKVWAGLATNPSGSNIFVSGGGGIVRHGLIKRLANVDLNPVVRRSLTKPVLHVTLRNNRLTPLPGLAIPSLAAKKRFIAGIAMGRDGSLYVVNDQTNTVYKLNPKDDSVLASVKVGYRPFAIAISPDFRTVAVTNWGGKSVSLLDAATLKEISRVHVGSQPADLAYASDGRLFVVNAGSNSVSVIAGGKVIETIKTSLDPHDPVGSTPDAVAVSPDGRLLFVADADNNDVAMIDISKPANSRVLGFIPTGWYPSAIGVTPNGKDLLVATGKGMASRPNVPVLGKYPHRKPDPATPYDYVGDVLSGHLEIINVPGPAQLKTYTQEVYGNVPNPRRHYTPQEKAQALKAFSHIKHVLYIIRENRTYDEVFGDLPRGNGDPNLVFFGKNVTPNAHKLANETVILDNLYTNGEVSEDGHQWCDAAYATNFTEKAWPSKYSRRGQPRADGRLTASPAGYLWDNCRRHGVSYISFGEFSHFVSGPNMPPHYTSVAGLEGHYSKAWLKVPSWNDLDHAKMFINSLHKAEKADHWWQFMVMWLPEDHTKGLKAGALSPRAMVGSNDLALGRIVQAVTHSRFWPSTAIFVIEDDAQNGPDHVDDHRTVGLVLSPYDRRHIVDSTHYTTASMVRTIELILHLPIMTQYDRAATPMYSCFQSHRDLWTYNAIMPRTNLKARNPDTGPGAVASAKLDFSAPDLANPAALNEILWDALRPGQPMPAPVHSAVFVPGQ